MRYALVAVVLLSIAGGAGAENAIQPGTASADPPTVICLGVHWPYTGDDNRNAVVKVRYRVEGPGDEAWKDAMPLFRIRPENLNGDKFCPKNVRRAFAGSIFDLRPGTAYEIELDLSDPDGGSVKKTIRSRTRPVPKVPANLAVKKVSPGRLPVPRPGQVLLLEKGVYQGNVRIGVKATAQQPAVIRGVSRDEVIIEGNGGGRIIDATGSAHVYIENVTFRNGREAVTAHSATGLVVRRCRIAGMGWGIRNTVRGNPGRDFYISDNVFEGPCKWPAVGIEGQEAIEVLGSGHVVCHNKFVGYGDAISVFRNPAVSIDFYNNDIDVATDDGIEMDYSDRNTRVFRNRIYNARIGISTQPIYGGPCYIFRNECYNTSYGPLKLHNGPSGVLIYHNTSVKQGVALVVWSGAPVKDHVLMNNLFVGTGEQISDWTSKNTNVRLDYNGYGPGRGRFKISNVNYPNVKGAAKDGLEVHGKMLGAPFFEKPPAIPAKSAQRVKAVELDLAESSGAVDGGARLPNLNDGFRGRAPDMGSREFGGPKPHFGPRPEGVDESTVPAQKKDPDRKPTGPVTTASKAPPKLEGPTPDQKAAAEKRYGQLKKSVIEGASAGRRARVYVDIAGRPTRARVIAADDGTVKVHAGGLEVRMKWSALSSKRFYGIARKYTRDHAALWEYCVGNGLKDEAEREERQK